MNKILTSLLLLAMSIPAMADTPTYNFINAGFQRVQLDGNGVDVDGDGFVIAGAYEIADNWHIVASYASTGFDFSVDLNQLQIGAGYHTDISDTTNFFANALYVDYEVDTGGFGSVDDSGFGLAIGLRSNISSTLELEGSITHIDIGDADGTTLAGAGWYKFSREFAVGLNAAIEDDVTAFGIAGRLYF